MQEITTVGSRLRTLRDERDLTQRELARRAGLSPNSISLIERDEISPSVSTLQRLATALSVRMSYFFEQLEPASIIHVKAQARPSIVSEGVTIESIGARLRGQQVEPFLLTLAPGTGAGNGPVAHPGQEFVYCVQGAVEYEIEGALYMLEPGDFLLFDAALPHYWRNPQQENAQFLLLLQAPEGPQEPARRHFPSYPSVAHLG